MKIEKQLRDDHQIKLTAEFEHADLEQFRHRAARRIAKDGKIPGFRPGKAPYEIVLRTYGQELIDRQAMDLMMDDMYPEVIKEAEVAPFGPGNLEDIVSTDPPIFAFIVPLKPEVTLGDYRSIRQEYTLGAVTDEDVEKVIHNLRTSYAITEPVERAAQKEDLVYVKLTGTLVKPAEGEVADVISEAPYQFVIGDESDSWPYPHFADELIGLSAESVKSLPYTFPEDSTYERLRSKEIEFHITVQSVKTLSLPELTDEFAQTLGEYSTVVDLTAAIRKQLEESRKSEYEQEYITSVLGQIVTQSTIHYPPQMVSEEIDSILHDLGHDLEHQKMDMDTYLKTRGMNQADFVENEVKPVAIRRIERSLVMDEIAKAESIQLDPNELQKTVLENLNQIRSNPEMGIPRGMKVQQFVDALTMDTANRILNAKVLEQIKAITSGQAAELPAEVVAEPVAEGGKPAPKKRKKKVEPKQD